MARTRRREREGKRRCAACASHLGASLRAGLAAAPVRHAHTTCSHPEHLRTTADDHMPLTKRPAVPRVSKNMQTGQRSAPRETEPDGARQPPAAHCTKHGSVKSTTAPASSSARRRSNVKTAPRHARIVFRFDAELRLHARAFIVVNESGPHAAAQGGTHPRRATAL